MTDDHPTKLTEQEMMNDRIKKIVTDWANLPEEQRKRIAEKLAKEVGNAVKEGIFVMGASIMSALEELQESLETKPEEPSK